MRPPCVPGQESRAVRLEDGDDTFAPPPSLLHPVLSILCALSGTSVPAILRGCTRKAAMELIP
jgi:hypothetical protein